MYEITAQAIGFIGMALCIGCFQFKSSRMLVLCQMMGNFLYVIHYLMLGAYSGCVSMLLVAVNNAILSAKSTPWTRWTGWKWIISVLFAAACIGTWQDIFSILPCVASIIMVLTNWTFNGKYIRFGKLFAVGPGWVIYNIHILSWSGILCELIGMMSAGVSFVRYGVKQLDHTEGPHRD